MAIVHTVVDTKLRRVGAEARGDLITDEIKSLFIEMTVMIIDVEKGNVHGLLGLTPREETGHEAKD
jgi:hypothetical protein